MRQKSNRKHTNNWTMNRAARQEERETAVPKRELMVESFRLPKDSLLGALIVTVTGNTEAFVENYKGIITYTPQQILLQGKTCRIEICGKRLNIVYYTNEDMKINGYIENIRYLL